MKILEVLNNTLNNNQKEEFILALKKNSDILLSQIDSEYAGSLYFVEFKTISEEKQTFLDIDDFIHGIKVLNAIVDINKAIDSCCFNMQNNFENYNKNNECYVNDSTELFGKLNAKSGYLQETDNEAFKFRYLNALIACKQLKNNNNLSMSETKNNVSLSDSGHSEGETVTSNLLTHYEIQECVGQVNYNYGQECLSLVLINEALLGENIPHTLIAIKSLPKDEKIGIIDQNAYLYHTELKKMLETKEKLDYDDIKAGIKECNILLESALNMTKTMILINQIDVNKKNEIINLIRDRSLGIKILGDQECVDSYYQTFKDLKRICKAQPFVNTEYFCNKTVEDYDFYLNLKNASIYSWTPPLNYVETTNLITRTILKKAIDVTSEKFQTNLLYQSKEGLIVLVQALARGFLLRKALNERKMYLKANMESIVKIQSWWKMLNTKRNYKKRVELLKSSTKSVVLIQSFVRMWLLRKRFVERKEYFHENENAVVKIQSYVRAKRARNDYTSLSKLKIKIF